MKYSVYSLFFFLAVTISSFATAFDDKLDPGIYLNPQDVPLFYKGNPLEGMNAFTVLLPCSLQDKAILEKMEELIEKELGAIGTTIKAKNDVTGFGAGNLLSIQIGPVSKWEGGALPIFRVTLNVETFVTINRTSVKSVPRVWSINEFVDAPLDIQSEGKALGAVQKLLKEFVKNYKFVNANQTQKPTFYLY